MNHDDKASLMEDARRQEIQSQLQLQDQEIEYDMGQLEETERQIRQIEVSSRLSVRTQTCSMMWLVMA